MRVAGRWARNSGPSTRGWFSDILYRERDGDAGGVFSNSGGNNSNDSNDSNDGSDNINNNNTGDPQSHRPWPHDTVGHGSRASCGWGLGLHSLGCGITISTN